MGSQGHRYSSYPGGFSSSKNEIKPKTAGILRVMPCTVSQLLSAREHRDSFFIRDMELNQVTVVGLIRRTTLTLTHIVYSVDDMTGPPLDIKQWQNFENTTNGSPKEPRCKICVHEAWDLKIGNSYVVTASGFKSWQMNNLVPVIEVYDFALIDEGDSHSLVFRREVEYLHFLQNWLQSSNDLARWFQGTMACDVNMNHCVIPSGTYVKVVGSLRSFQHHRSMVAFNIRRLDDFNEITSHMLEVIQAHLDSASSSCTMINTSHASDPTSIGFTANQRQVYTSIKNCPLAEGISMQRLRNSLKYLSSYDIRNCLQFLINEGHIFSTIDDFHFKCTNG